MIERAKLTYSPLGKAFRKQTKTTEKQKDKQVEALRNQKSPEQQKPKSIEDILPKELQINEI